MAGNERTEDRPASKRVGALRGLLPFLRPYRRGIALAGAALVLTAAVSLILPLAVRRVIDGFGAAETSLLDQYFAAALVIAAILALGTGFNRERRCVLRKVKNHGPATDHIWLLGGEGSV